MMAARANDARSCARPGREVGLGAQGKETAQERSLGGEREPVMGGRGALREKMGTFREKVGAWDLKEARARARRRSWGGNARSHREPRSTGPGAEPTRTLTPQHGCLVEALGARQGGWLTSSLRHQGFGAARSTQGSAVPAGIPLP